MAKKPKKKKKKAAGDGRRVIARNRRARHDYEFIELHEAGIVLTGSEVKSLRDGKASIAEAYARIRDMQVEIVGMHIAEYPDATYNNHEPDRTRRLLLHKKEIRKLARQVKLRGFTLVPVELYFDRRGWAKITIALARGRRSYDKRRELKKKDMKRELRSY